jgi:hypothetical protein
MSASTLRQIVEKQYPELFWDPADPTKTLLSAKVISLKPSNRKRKSPLPQKWEDVFWDEVVTFAAFRELAPVERSLLYELFAMARRLGTETPIGCSASMAANMCDVSRRYGVTLLSALEEKGFIVSIVRGRQHRQERVASNWRLSFLPYRGNPPTREYVRRFYKAKDMEAFEATNAKFFNEKLEAMWLENEAKYEAKPADFDESQWA